MQPQLRSTVFGPMDGDTCLHLGTLDPEPKRQKISAPPASLFS